MIFVRNLFGCALATALVCTALMLPAKSVLAQDKDDLLSRDSVLRDSSIPVMGNPEGDITIVEYFDYQCPYCKKAEADLAQVVREDGKIRLVMKDWPIFPAPSGFAARLVLATQYQGKYDASHRAVMAVKGKLTESDIRDALAKADVDVAKAEADLETHKSEIDAIVKRNTIQAQSFGFVGTPGFIIGTFRVPMALDVANFKQAVADARAAAKKSKK
jgi:protein-disulfide isomerase